MKTNEIYEIEAEGWAIRFRLLADGSALFALPDGRTHGCIPPAEPAPRHLQQLEAWIVVSIGMERYHSNPASEQFAFHARAKR
jgi:hypothetical protein